MTDAERQQRKRDRDKENLSDHELACKLRRRLFNALAAWVDYAMDYPNASTTIVGDAIDDLGEMLVLMTQVSTNDEKQEIRRRYLNDEPLSKTDEAKDETDKLLRLARMLKGRVR
jgi:hypothetical protein